MKLTVDMVAHIMPLARSNGLDNEFGYLLETCKRFEITTKNRLAAFLTNVAKESGELFYVEEIADGWAYEGRGDLGNIVSGDGPRFKGHGYIQVTGRNNHKTVGDALGVDAISDPLVLTRMPYAWLSAGYYWRYGSSWGNLNEYADAGDFRSTILGVRGGPDPDREHYWWTAMEVLPDDLELGGESMSVLDAKKVDDFAWYCQQMKGRPYTYERGRDGTTYEQIIASSKGPDCSGMFDCVMEHMGIKDPSLGEWGTVAISEMLVQWEVYDPEKFYPRGTVLVNDNATGWITGDDSHVAMIIEDEAMIPGYSGQRLLHSWNPKGVDDTGTDVASHEYARYEWAGFLPQFLKEKGEGDESEEVGILAPGEYFGIRGDGVGQVNSSDCSNGWYWLPSWEFVGKRWTETRGYF